MKVQKLCRPHYSSQQSRKVSAGFMGHAPEAILRQLGQGEMPEAMAKQDGNLRCRYRNQHIDYHRDGGKACEQTQEEQHAA